MLQQGRDALHRHCHVRHPTYPHRESSQQLNDTPDPMLLLGERVQHDLCGLLQSWGGGGQ